jgi:hypothetical protein
MEWDLSGPVESSRVMRANARTARPFRGHVVGTFERTGPNCWDPYRLVARDGPTVDVPVGLEVQVEDSGVRCRVRARGAVHVVEWRPTEDEAAATGADRTLRQQFFETCVTRFDVKRGIGAAAFIAKTLR